MAQGIFTKRQQLRGLIEKSWGVSSVTPQVEYLVVAGGGAGGGGAAYGGGGGGAGGLLQGIIPITAGSSLTVTVGAGGTGSCINGGNGANSVFGNITSIGGGGGNYGYGVGACGGSGGGNGSDYRNPGPGTLVFSQPVAGQGNRGGGQVGSPGGGGGAGSAGICGRSPHSAGNGGVGVASAIGGVLSTYAGGGGGAADYNACSIPILGGAGGGGNGAYSSTGGQNTAGSSNTGGGGGAANNVSGKTVSSNGGSGIVIISYPDIYNAPASFGGANSPTASTSGSGSIYYTGNTQQALVYSGLSSLSSVSGNFTIEYWMYPTSYGSYPTTITNYPAQSTYILHQFGPSGGSSFGMSTVTGFSSFTANLNTWYHIAMVRSGSTITNYVNGSSIGSFASTETFNFSTLGIGNYTVTSNYPFYGGITNLRVTTSAVYTSNFTPSTAPLPALSGTGLLLNAVSGAPFVNSVNSGSLSLYSSGIAPTWNQSSPFATGLGYKNRVYTWIGSGTVTF
jgi:hypothetical protein